MSLHDSGWSYRRISKHLNEKGIPTPKGKRWGETGNSVYSVLKRYQERQERLDLIQKEYPIEWGRMRIEWSKNSKIG